MKTIYLVAGARPNFMKIAPILRTLRSSKNLGFKLIHTGQHYDHEMSDVFFDELGIPMPDYHLEAGGGSHARQTAKIMTAFEDICMNDLPDCVLVVGDVNSTLACAIVAKKLNVPVAHVEAGLRSGDMRMPEEVNRIVTDAISDWFFVTESAGVDNLLREGKDKNSVFFVGHVMIDNLLYQSAKLKGMDKSLFESEEYKRKYAEYGVVTLHRPSNVDNKETLSSIAGALRMTSERLPLVFPVHPRTKANLEKFDLNLGERIHLTKPLSYMEFLNLWQDASLILTDSGGLQEETTALGIPCLTLRENTERPVTLEQGTNVLVGSDPEVIYREAELVLESRGKKGRRPALWDGRAAERIVDTLNAKLT